MEPIAIVGIGCRFPGGADNPEAFWRLLRDGFDAISEVPGDRFDVEAVYQPGPAAPGKVASRRGAYLEGVDLFDAAFFNVSPREAALMDPQQRLLLEAAWEALEDGGLTPAGVPQERAGVFLGMISLDYQALLFTAPEILDLRSYTGATCFGAAGRLSYSLGWNGPSFTVDTACSSSLVAVHLACQSLWTGECEVALAGGAYLMLQPYTGISLSQAGILSPDGRSKFGDARADGFGISDGVGLVVLKPLRRALEDGDPLYAVVRGSAVNNGGSRTAGMARPSGAAQEMVIREACRRAGVSPGQVMYVEAHGTGTVVGDRIELQSLGAALAEDRPAGRPCRVGSVKTNLGHTGGTAGVAGLIKLALMLRHREIAPSLHFETPNPEVDWSTLPLTVAAGLAPWPEGPALAGVNSFGVSGTNAHVILEEAPPSTVTAARPRPAWLLPLSARSPAALNALADAYAERLENAGEDLGDVCYTAGVRRAHHPHRAAFVASSAAGMAERLRSFLPGESPAPETDPRPVFVFPGQGTQWLGMGRDLLRDEPVFRDALERCAAAIRAHVSWDLLEELQAGEASSRLAEIDVVQPILFSLQVALAALWESWGVRPAAVVGHSLGEVAAAHVAGALSLEDAARIICRRSLLLRTLSGRGAMLATELTLEQAESFVHGHEGREDRLAVAVSNGPRSTVLSGDTEALRAVAAELERRELFCRWIRVDVASHSPLVDPLCDDLLEALRDLASQAGTIPMISTVTGEVCDGPELDAGYWMRNLRQPVLFWGALRRLVEERGLTCFLELSPHPALLTAVESGLQHLGRNGAALPSLRRDQPALPELLTSLGTLYERGYPVEWTRLHPEGGRCVPLPRYPWQRERYWADVPPIPFGSAPTPRPDRAPRDWFLDVVWSPAETPAAAPPSGPGTWVLIDADHPVGDALLARLAPRVRLTRPEHLQRLLLDLEAEGAPCRAVLHLGALSTETPADDLDEARLRGCTPLLHLVQTLAGMEGQAILPQLWIVTRGVQAARSQDPVLPAQAPLAGLARVVSHEHPGLVCRRVDLAPQPEEGEIEALLRALGATDREDEVALRGGVRLAPRLTRRRDPGNRKPYTASFDPRATWLITGGLGGIGLALAHWMAERGARHLVLVGRSAPGAAAEAELARLRTAGTEVRVVQADVSDPNDLSRVWDGLGRELPPLKGVFHAAGVLDDGLLCHLDDDRLKKVFRAKVTGAWNLHTLTAGMELERFVLFSSVAALLGPPGQGSHAAANAFLDALAHHRRHLGLPALSVNWGAWAQVGAAVKAGVEERLALRGVASMPPRQALAALEELLGAEPAQAAVSPLDAQAWSRTCPAAERSSLLAGLLAGEGDPRSGTRGTGPDRLSLLAADDLERRRLVSAYLAERAAAILRKPASQLDLHGSLVRQGFDSLMSLELKNRLESDLDIRLPLSTLLQSPGLAELEGEILSLLQQGEPAPAVEIPLAKTDPAAAWEMGEI